MSHNHALVLLVRERVGHLCCARIDLLSYKLQRSWWIDDKMLMQWQWWQFIQSAIRITTLSHFVLINVRINSKKLVIQVTTPEAVNSNYVNPLFHPCSHKVLLDICYLCLNGFMTCYCKSTKKVQSLPEAHKLQHILLL